MVALIMNKIKTRKPAYEKPIFENQPVWFHIQGCYFQGQPEVFLN